jgi:uncharacterized membrane protein YjjP (DUF1212 family)
MNAPVNIEQRSALVLTTAKGLFVNGQSTEQTVAAAGRLADALGLHTRLLARWSELALLVDGANGALIRLEGAEPTGIEMDRVASVTRVIDISSPRRHGPKSSRPRTLAPPQPGCWRLLPQLAPRP